MSDEGAVTEVRKRGRQAAADKSEEVGTYRSTKWADRFNFFHDFHFLVCLLYQSPAKKGRASASPAKSADAPAKRGRGRPKGSGKKSKAAKAKVKVINYWNCILNYHIILRRACVFVCIRTIFFTILSSYQNF